MCASTAMQQFCNRFINVYLNTQIAERSHKARHWNFIYLFYMCLCVCCCSMLSPQSQSQNRFYTNISKLKRMRKKKSTTLFSACECVCVYSSPGTLFFNWLIKGIYEQKCVCVRAVYKFINAKLVCKQQKKPKPYIRKPNANTRGIRNTDVGYMYGKA